MSALRTVQIAGSAITAVLSAAIIGLTATLIKEQSNARYDGVPVGVAGKPREVVDLFGVPRSWSDARPLAFLVIPSLLLVLNAASTAFFLRDRKSTSGSRTKNVALSAACSINVALGLALVICGWYDATRTLSFDEIKGDLSAGYGGSYHFGGAGVSWDAFNWNCKALPFATVGNRQWGNVFGEVVGLMSGICNKSTAAIDLSIPTLLFAAIVLGSQLWTTKKTRQAEPATEKNMADDSESEVYQTREVAK